jgi:hypothetical protein
MTTLKRRIEILERRTDAKPADAPDLDGYIVERNRLAQWLRDRELTAEKALARGERGPEGLRWASLAGLLAAQRRTAAYRKQRLLEKPVPQKVPYGDFANCEQYQ